MESSAKQTSAPKKSSSQKYDDTTAAALDIIDKEADARERKTARLKALRLAREAEEVVTAPVKKKRAKA